MKNSKKIKPIMILCILTINIVATVFLIQTVTDNNKTTLEFLRGLGIIDEDKGSYTPVSHLRNSSSPSSLSFPKGIHAKLQEVPQEPIEDYVDQTSDVDSSPDLGSHDVFNDLRATDSIYDTMSETGGASTNIYSWDAPGGFGNYLQVGTSGLTDFGSTNGTISMWLKFDVIAGRFWGQHTDFEIRFSNPNLDLDWGGTSTISYVHGMTVTNKWYFWAVTWDEIANTIYIYEGDENNQPTQVASNTNWYGQVSTLGVTENNIMNSRGGTYQVDGHVEDFRYYDTDRSLSAIQSDYKTPLAQGQRENLIHYYQFENKLDDEEGSVNLVQLGSGSFSTDIPSGMGGSSGDYQLDLEVQFTDVIDFLGDGELCIKTGSLGSENINVTYWDGDSWELIFNDLAADSWNNHTILQNNFTSSTFTIKFGGSTTSSDSIQDSWNIDAVLLRVKDQDEVWGDEYGFIWLDNPDEVDLSGTDSGSWGLNVDLSDDSVPDNATGVILAWVQLTSNIDHAVARGSEDRSHDYMNGGSTYCEFEGQTWRMQIVKLGAHKYIDTWRETSNQKLYVMGYTVGADPRFKPVPSDLGSLTASSSWQTMTVSGVDENTTGVILFGQTTSFSDTTLLVRAVGSTDSMTNREWEQYNCGVLFVEIDNNDQFQYYVTAGRSAKLYLIAEVGDSIDWLDINRTDISATTTGWSTRDLDSYFSLSSNASGVILQLETTRIPENEYDYKNIARKYGQTWTFLEYDVGGDQWMMSGSGIDSEHKLEIYAESTRSDAYIHAITRYIVEDNNPPVINSFGVDDLGNGIGIFWANVSDTGSDVANVTLKVDSIEYNMSYNGTYWVNASPPVVYGASYDYQISNTSDTIGNKILSPSGIQSHTFNYDTKAPELIPADKYYFYNDTTKEDEFRVNITNSWGVAIDTVTVNGTIDNWITNRTAVMRNYTDFGSGIHGYINDTLTDFPFAWDSGSVINYTIFVNDTAGNYYISDIYEGYKYGNNAPWAENITYSPRPLLSNGTLNLTYDWDDIDENGTEGATHIQWWRKPDGTAKFQLEFLHNDSTEITAEYLIKGDEWYAVVIPKDGELFGDPVNESLLVNGTIVILNTPPSLTALSWQNQDYYTSDDLRVTFIFVDDDPSDTENTSERITYWYINGSYDSDFDNYTFIPSINTTKAQNWSVVIRIFDGTNYSNIFYSLLNLNITILNSPPEVELVAIDPINPFTTDNLNTSWNFIDADDDQEDTNSFIFWYKNGVPQPRFTNKTKILANETSRGDNWQFECLVTDGFNYSTSNFWSGIRTINNSQPQVIDIQINSNAPKIYTTDDLDITLWVFNDSDEEDVEVDSLVLWYLNDNIQPLFTNLSSISFDNTIKGQEWKVSIALKDNGGLWSDLVNSSLIIISNSLPEINIHADNHPEFFIESQNLELQINYFTFTDDDMDADISLLKWFKNETYQPEYDNEIVPASDTHPGDVWYYVLTPFDGDDVGTDIKSPSFVIESIPVINSYNFNPINDTEGHYELEFNITDSRNVIKQVEFYIYLNSTDALPAFIRTSPRIGYPNLWILDYYLTNYSYLNTLTLMNVTIITEVTYSIFYEISLTQNFNFTILDKAPPRVITAWFEKDNDENPTSLTFYAEIDEEGSGISEITLFYYFNPSESGGGGSSLQQESSVSMIFDRMSADYYIYSVTVDIGSYDTDLDIEYHISTTDTDGNINDLAFDNSALPEQRIPYTSPGLPEWLVIVGVLIIFVIFVGSVVYVRFIRKPEIRGLDKELILEGVKEITDAEIMNSLDTHTIGIVVSFFDQRHGPVPIITIPDILKDNWAKLVELSDRSFSGTQFTDEYDMETVSNYDFLLDRGLRVSVMSFGFSLERPEARGGQENVTENVLIHKEVFPLLNQFQDEIQPLIHKTHVLMDKEGSEKGKIQNSVFRLRKYITAIVLSYQSIYGTIELLEEED